MLNRISFAFVLLLIAAFCFSAISVAAAVADDGDKMSRIATA